ncbi:hypothetical protein WA158_007476 [Blastocystis sp. Blastoise]
MKENIRFDIHQIESIQNDVFHFERLISDLIGVLTSSIGFCIHSGDSVNQLLKRFVNEFEGIQKEKDSNSRITIKEPSFIHEMNHLNNDNDVDLDVEHIRFSNRGVLYSLPKKTIDKMVGSFIYDQYKSNIRCKDGSIYLDYSGDDTCVPFLIDFLMNKSVNIKNICLKDQLDLVELFEFCNLPLPEELMLVRDEKSRCFRYNPKYGIRLYVNDIEDELLSKYCIQNNILNRIINKYGHGYVDYNQSNNKFSMHLYYTYISYIHDYILSHQLFIDPSIMKTIQKTQLENEMYDLFGIQGKNAVIEGWGIKKYFKNSYIVNSVELEKPLIIWLGEKKKWKLLFRASEHEYRASEFHSYCDNKGETVTIIKHIGHNNHINIFGGYTDQHWDCSQRKISYSKEFLFTITNEHNMPPSQYGYISIDTCRREDYGGAIYCSQSYGPCFGHIYDSHQLLICDNCHTSNKSYCYSGYYAINTTPQNYSLFVNTNATNSENFFIVDDYEVWGIDN